MLALRLTISPREADLHAGGAGGLPIIGVRQGRPCGVLPREDRNRRRKGGSFLGHRGITTQGPQNGPGGYNRGSGVHGSGTVGSGTVGADIQGPVLEAGAVGGGREQR